MKFVAKHKIAGKQAEIKKSLPIFFSLLLVAFASPHAARAQVKIQPIESLVTVQSRRDELSRLIAERERLLATNDNKALLQVNSAITELHLKLAELDAGLAAATQCVNIATTFAGTNDAALLVEALILLGRTHIRRNENHEALRPLDRALALSKELSFSEGEAQSLYQIAVVNFELGKHLEAEKANDQALQIWKEHSNQRGEAQARSVQGIIYLVLDRNEEAATALKSAEALWRSLGDAAELANTLIDQNFLAIRQGQWQAALTLLNEAQGLLVEKEAEAYIAGKIAMSLGDVYEAYGQLQTSLAYYRDAQHLYRDVVRDKRAAIDAGNQVGRLQARLGDYASAQKQIEETLNAALEIGNNLNIGFCYEDLGRVWLEARVYESARKEFLHAIEYLTASQAPWPLARAQIYLGQTEHLLGNVTSAETAYRSALKLFQTKKVLDYTGEAALRYGLGKLALQQRRFDEAEKQLKRSIELTKQLRENAASKDLRSSFLASVHDRYETYVELLMTRVESTGNRDFEKQAFEASESGRALALLDSLRSQQKEIRHPSDPMLLLEEERLQKREQELLDSLAELVSRGGSAQDREKVSAELTDVRSRYETLQARINTNAKFTNLLWPEPDYQKIKDQLIDANTTLLEYSLGDTNSFAWIITQNGLASRKLEDKHVIERAVDQLLTLLQKPSIDSDDEARLQTAVNDVSRLVLEPVSDQLRTSRLIVIADGGLQRVPFQVLKALPSATEPLVAQFEIVDAPSASALASVRQERMHRQPGTKMVVGFGDAVFAPDSSKPVQADAQTRAGESRNVVTLPTLFNAKRELRAIEDLAGNDSAFYTKYAATRDNFLNMNFSQFRIVHVVTHGILNDVEPQLSGLYLTRVDAENRPLAGFVGLTDIYKMNTSVDLVVLSACQTALGKELRGEGLIGLTRGFMYAGAASVVASLWQVDDAASAELMKYFYTYLLQDGMTPPAALRAAQNKIRAQPKWRSPFYWAGFTIQGDYDLNFKSPARSSNKKPVIVLVAGVVVVIAIALWYTRRRKANVN
jgi:CHAT domain-containing protein